MRELLPFLSLSLVLSRKITFILSKDLCVCTLQEGYTQVCLSFISFLSSIQVPSCSSACVCTVYACALYLCCAPAKIVLCSLYTHTEVMHL